MNSNFAACVLQAGGQGDWGLPEGWRLEHPALAGEEVVGGVYVRLFLKNPTFPLRSPRAFLQVRHAVTSAVLDLVLHGIL